MKRIVLFVLVLASVGGLCEFGLPKEAGADIKIRQNASKTQEILPMRITAYASVPEETSDHPFITASGEHVRDGVVASNLLPFGTKIEIPKLFGDKIFIVEDRMNHRFENTIDIWMSSRTKAKNFGVAHTSVVVVSNVTSSAISEANPKNDASL